MTADAPNLAFDAAALKRHFPGLADPQLHYLDNAATAQMPEVVLSALRQFEIEARANVHEGVHRRARAATDAYQRARVSIARFLGASSKREVIFTYGTTSSINMLAHCLAHLFETGETRFCCRCSSIIAIWCLGRCSLNSAGLSCGFCQ
jgi:cysteine desulfurase / selenocysteine lyase